MQTVSKKILEIACFSQAAAEIAIHYGAQRIELCHDYRSGGVTPSIHAIKGVRKITVLPVFAMIRPRSGDFHYSGEEFTEMKNSLLRIKNAGADGFVFGILDENKSLDTERCSELVRLAYPLPCTLHRAFDYTGDFPEKIDKAVSIGFKRILTSGGRGNCIKNIPTLKEIVSYSAGRIEIIAGGGIRSKNLHNLLNINGLNEFHSSAIPHSDTNLPYPGEILKIQEILLLKQNELVVRQK